MVTKPCLGTQKPGDTIVFGAYPQTAEGLDLTPIRWRVLRNEGSRLRLLSDQILDCQPYHETQAAVAWADCSLRRWLNEQFVRQAFGAAEQQLIRPMACDGQPEAWDWVFLLSEEESEDLPASSRGATGTAYARAARPGRRLYVYDKSVEANVQDDRGERLGCSWWWLRAGGNRPDRACFVGTRGSVRHYGQVSLTCYGVRPAIWLIGL